MYTVLRKCLFKTGIKSRLAFIPGPPHLQTIWTPYLCKELVLAAEESNLFDRHAVAVLKTGKIVDDMPNELAQVLKSDSGSVKAAACSLPLLQR